MPSAATAVFSVVDQTVLRRPPFTAGERLVDDIAVHRIQDDHRAAGHAARACGKHGLTPGVDSPRYPVSRQVRTVDKIESAPCAWRCAPIAAV